MLVACRPLNEAVSSVGFEGQLAFWYSSGLFIEFESCFVSETRDLNTLFYNSLQS